jgi:hypothetical protein
LGFNGRLSTSLSTVSASFNFSGSGGYFGNVSLLLNATFGTRSARTGFSSMGDSTVNCVAVIEGIMLVGDVGRLLVVVELAAAGEPGRSVGRDEKDCLT